MKTKVSIPIVMLFCLLVGQVQAAETPPIVETFSCHLNEGSDAGDVQSAVDYWKQQVKKIDNEALNQYAAWMVTPIRSPLPYNFYWLGGSPNMNTWAKGGAAYAASSEGQAAQARFDKISTCTSQTWVSEQLMGDGPQTDDNGVMEVYGCTLHKGKTMSNVRAVEENYVKTAKAAGVGQSIFRFSPMHTNGDVDLLYLVGYGDMESYGSTVTQIFTTDSTRTANQYFSLVMDCGSGLYNVDTIKAPPSE
ncbi:MAG: hypothetical protein ISP91_14235 [Pseudomonadales bacterium]|nr:hypothetical protein [Pseudomonadales bacterium]